MGRSALTAESERLTPQPYLVARSLPHSQALHFHTACSCAHTLCTWIVAQLSTTSAGSSPVRCLHTGGASAMNGIAPVRPSHFGTAGTVWNDCHQRLKPDVLLPTLDAAAAALVPRAPTAIGLVAAACPALAPALRAWPWAPPPAAAKPLLPQQPRRAIAAALSCRTFVALVFVMLELILLLLLLLIAKAQLVLVARAGGLQPHCCCSWGPAARLVPLCAAGNTLTFHGKQGVLRACVIHEVMTRPRAHMSSGAGSGPCKCCVPAAAASRL